MPRFKYSVYWTENARSNIESIIDSLASESIDNATSVLYEIKQKTHSLHTIPERGRVVLELKYYNIDNYRELIKNPWRIIKLKKTKSISYLYWMVGEILKISCLKDY